MPDPTPTNSSDLASASAVRGLSGGSIEHRAPWTQDRVRRNLPAILTGVLFGFSALLLAHKYFAARLFPAPAIPYTVFTTPNPRLFQDVYEPAIKSAHHEILVAAREISSRRLLEALRAKTAAGVEVDFLLSPDAGNQATLRWIAENHAGRVYIDSQPLADQLVVIDGNQVILTPLPFTADAPAGIQSSGLAVEEAGLGQKLRRQFLQKISQLPIVRK